MTFPHVYAMGLITKIEKAEIDLPMLTKQGRMDKLLGAVLSAINIDQLKYDQKQGNKVAVNKATLSIWGNHKANAPV